MLALNWQTCGQDGHWCSLLTLDLDSMAVERGVYIIWHAGNPGRVIWIGQGYIGNRLREHRQDPAILEYADHGPLRVTWAAVPASQIDGVERYLADYWKPLIADRHPNMAPVEVNSPFAA